MAANTTTKFLMYLLLFGIVFALQKVTTAENYTFCAEVPKSDLELILGPAYNERFMSITRPKEDENGKAFQGKRETLETHSSFYVDDPNYTYEFGDQAAWSVKSHRFLSTNASISRKRQANYNSIVKVAEVEKPEWKCAQRFSWTDMGLDYFPRYLRNVECEKASCWRNVYTCKARSLTVRLLKRKRGKCILVEPGTTVGQYDLPMELIELWVWEERAVRFCCDCQLV